MFPGRFGGFGGYTDYRPLPTDIPLTEDGQGNMIAPEHPAEGIRMPQTTSQTVDPEPVLAVSSPAADSPVPQDPDFSYADDADALAELI